MVHEFKSGKGIASICKGFWKSPEHLASLFSHMTRNTPPLTKNVHDNFTNQIKYLELVLRDRIKINGRGGKYLSVGEPRLYDIEEYSSYGSIPYLLPIIFFSLTGKQESAWIKAVRLNSSDWRRMVHHRKQAPTFTL